MMVSDQVSAIAVLAGLYAFFWAWLRLTQDAKEPLPVEQAAPFMSPVVGMVTRGSEFYLYLR
jgi:hypothetical protein